MTDVYLPLSEPVEAIVPLGGDPLVDTSKRAKIPSLNGGNRWIHWNEMVVWVRPDDTSAFVATVSQAPRCSLSTSADKWTISLLDADLLLVGHVVDDLQWRFSKCGQDWYRGAFPEHGTKIKGSFKRAEYIRYNYRPGKCKPCHC